MFCAGSRLSLSRGRSRSIPAVCSCSKAENITAGSTYGRTGYVQRPRLSATLTGKICGCKDFNVLMLDQKRIWRIVVPLALLVLVLASTFGMVWHHHDNSSPESCPLCH